MKETLTSTRHLRAPGCESYLNESDKSKLGNWSKPEMSENWDCYSLTNVSEEQGRGGIIIFHVNVVQQSA